MKYFKYAALPALFLLATSLVLAASSEQIRKNVLQLGENSTDDKEIVFDIDEGSSNPRIRANGTSKQLELSNNGTDYTPVAGQDLLDQRELKFYEDSANGSNYFGISAPDALSGDSTLKWPDGDGVLNEVLATDGAGGLKWLVTLANPMDSPGDMVIGSTGGAPTTLESGAQGTVLENTTANTPTWTSAPSVTRVAVRNGTTSAPSVQFSEDASGDTGFYRPSEGKISISTNNAETFIFEGGQLTLRNASNPTLLLKADGTTNDSILRFGDSDSDTAGGIFYDHSTDDFKLDIGGVSYFVLEPGSLTVRNSSNANAILKTSGSDTGASAVIFQDANEYNYRISLNHTTDKLTFIMNGTDRANVDVSGNMQADGHLTLGATANGGNTPHACEWTDSLSIGSQLHEEQCPGTKKVMAGGCNITSSAVALIYSYPDEGNRKWKCRAVSNIDIRAFAWCCQY